MHRVVAHLHVTHSLQARPPLQPRVTEVMSLASRAFHGCYLLVSRCSHNSSRTYIGFTVNPSRRIRQHNGEITSGAYRTKRGRPWEMVLVLYGFTTQVQALQFEWAWQHPEKSKAARVVAAALKKSQRLGPKGKVRLLLGMLHESPWCYYPLTLHFMSQEHAQLMAGCPAPPPYVDVVVAPMEALPKNLAVEHEEEQQEEQQEHEEPQEQQASGATAAAKDNDGCGCSNYGGLSGSDEEGTLFQRLGQLRAEQFVDAAADAGCSVLQVDTADTEAAATPRKARQKKEKGPRCQQCECAIERHMLSCNCGAQFHIDCLAQSFQQQQQQQQQWRVGPAGPADGRCPVCGARLVWMELLERMQSYGGPQPPRTSRQKRRAPKGTAATKAATTTAAGATKQRRAKGARAAQNTGDTGDTPAGPSTSNGVAAVTDPAAPKPARKCQPRKASSQPAATAVDGGLSAAAAAAVGTRLQPEAAKPARKRQPRKSESGDASDAGMGGAAGLMLLPDDQLQPGDVAAKAVRQRQPRKPKDATAARPPSNTDQAAASAAAGAAAEPALASVLQQLVVRLAQVCPGVALPYDRPAELLALIRMALPGMDIPAEILQQAAAAAAAAGSQAVPSVHDATANSQGSGVVDLLTEIDCSDQEASSSGRDGSNGRASSSVVGGVSSSNSHGCLQSSRDQYSHGTDSTPPKRRRALHNTSATSQLDELNPEPSISHAAAAATPSPGPLLRRLRLATASPAVRQALNPGDDDAGMRGEAVVDLCGPSPAPLWQRLAAAAPRSDAATAAATVAADSHAVLCPSAASGLHSGSAAAKRARERGTQHSHAVYPTFHPSGNAVAVVNPSTDSTAAAAANRELVCHHAGSKGAPLPPSVAAAAAATAAISASPNDRAALRRARLNGTTPAALRLGRRLQAADVISIDSD